MVSEPATTYIEYEIGHSLLRMHEIKWVTALWDQVMKRTTYKLDIYMYKLFGNLSLANYFQEEILPNMHCIHPYQLFLIV